MMNVPAPVSAPSAPSALSEPSDQVVLTIDQLVKDFDSVRAVDAVSLTINKGEIFALLGSSGCGKSTLLRMLAGFETPTSGSIVLNGHDMAGVAPYQRPVNMMFQSYALFPHLSVWDNVAFGLRRDGLPRDQIAERVEAMLAMVQLSSFARRRPDQLSGGQQQRVALARSLVKRPQLLLLDEPLGALDKKLREQTQLELVNIINQVGVTCVMVTHDQEEAMTMATRIAVMSEGRILQVGKPDDVYETPNCRFVAGFIGTINLFAGKVVEDEPDHVVIESAQAMHYIGHGISGTLGMEVTVGVRPEKIALGTLKPQVEEGYVALNTVEGEVVDLAYLGSYSIYHIRLADGMVIKASVANRARHAEHVQLGQTVYASWDAADSVVLTH